MGSNIWVQVYDYRYMITGIWLQVYDYRYMIADIWFQTYDMMTDIWLQTYDTHIWLSSKTLCLHTYDHIPPYMVFTYMILVHVYGTHICVCRHMIHIYVYLFPWDVASASLSLATESHLRGSPGSIHMLCRCACKVQGGKLKKCSSHAHPHDLLILRDTHRNSVSAEQSNTTQMTTPHIHG